MLKKILRYTGLLFIINVAINIFPVLGTVFMLGVIIYLICKINNRQRGWRYQRQDGKRKL